MQILLFGHNGQVGWELQRALAPLGDVISLDHRSSSYCGDLANPLGIAQTIRALQPDVIVNAAAYTNVDRAEHEKEQAYLINATCVEVLAKEAEKINALLIHFSTDYVFSGAGDTPWIEQDETAPVNIYGITKVKGEEAIQKYCKNYYIFRTSWAYSLRGDNFAKKIVSLALQHEELSIINDQYGAPTGADLIADCVAHAIRYYSTQPESSGIYHLVASGYTTWYEYSVTMFDIAKRLGLKLKVEKVIPVASNEYKTTAQRPLNSRLSIEKFEDTFKLTLPHWSVGVERLLIELIESKNIKI